MESTGWKMTAKQFEEAMSPATKMVILNSPGNPTGAVYTKEELLAIGEIALQEDIMIEAFEDCVVLRQMDEMTETEMTITLSLRQVQDLAAALDLPEGSYRIERK
jgi:bifunctional pyridoxal-dependent enzyme with beta-cystathionase and maltose regulon repressor activities